MAQHVMHYGDKAWTLEVADENLVAELESRTAEPSALSEAEIVRQALPGRSWYGGATRSVCWCRT